LAWKYATHSAEVHTTGSTNGRGGKVASVVSVKASTIALRIAFSR
jgi:hypothetical protein